MAKGNETTTKFKVDISELKKAMTEAKKQVAYANSEFKEASSSLDDWSKSSDGISAKLKQLNSNLKSQESVLAEYEKALEEVKKEYGENSDEAREYATKLNNQKAVVNKIRKEIAGYEDALTEVSEAEKIASKTGQDVADVLADVGKEADDAGDGFTTLKGAVATFVGNGLTALASGLKDAITSFMSLADETREYREQMNKLESASAEAGYGVDYAKEKYKELYGILGDETASTTALNNFMALELEQGQLNGLINSATGIWAKYGDSIPLDGLAESINETAKVGTVTGNLADALNWAGVSEDEFNERLAECTDEQARQKLIIAILNKEYGELGKSYKDSNASIIEAREAQADYTDTLAEMGEKVEPVTTALKTGFNGLLQELLKLVGDVDMEAFTAKIEEGFTVIKNDVLPAVKEGITWLINNKELVIGVVTGIATAVAGLKVLSFVTMIADLIAKVKSMTTVITVLKTVFTALTGPVGIVIAVISALVAGFMYLWNTCEPFKQFWINLWEDIKNACSVAKDWIGEKIEGIGKFFTETLPNFFTGLIDWIKENWLSILLFLINPFAGLFTYFYQNNTKFKEFVDNAIKYIKELPAKVQTWLTNTIAKVTAWTTQMITKAKETALNFLNNVVNFFKQLPEKVWTWLVNTITKITTWGANLATKGKEAAQKLLTSVVDKVKEIPDKVKSIAGDIVTGLWNGMSDKVGWLKDQISGFVGNVTDWLKEFFDINSPSKVMADEVGRWLPEGIAVGINKNAKSAINAMKDLAIDTVGSARAGLRTASTTIGGNGAVGGGVVNNFYQTINSPKPLNRLEIYRQTKNVIGYAGGGF